MMMLEYADNNREKDELPPDVYFGEYMDQYRIRQQRKYNYKTVPNDDGRKYTKLYNCVNIIYLLILVFINCRAVEAELRSPLYAVTEESESSDEESGSNIVIKSYTKSVIKGIFNGLEEHFGNNAEKCGLQVNGAEVRSGKKGLLYDILHYGSFPLQSRNDVKKLTLQKLFSREEDGGRLKYGQTFSDMDRTVTRITEVSSMLHPLRLEGGEGEGVEEP